MRNDLQEEISEATDDSSGDESSHSDEVTETEDDTGWTDVQIALDEEEFKRKSGRATKSVVIFWVWCLSCCFGYGVFAVVNDHLGRDVSIAGIVSAAITLLVGILGTSVTIRLFDRSDA